jgi:aspartate kinase
VSGEIVVVKFGGTSLAGPRRIRRAAARVRAHLRAGRRPVVVVSAVGRTTDRILRQLGAVAGAHPGGSDREVDRALATGEARAAALLALALSRLGVAGRSVSGAEAGVVAAGPFGAGRIRGIDPVPLLEVLRAGDTPVVCGFQGRRPDGETVTLTRGGSDTTAVALAATFWSTCQLVTDVDAVYDRDPRVDPGAIPFRTLAHEDLVVLATRGAQVVHPEAARLARAARVPLSIHHHGAGFRAEPGTVVGDPRRREVAA